MNKKIAITGATKGIGKAIAQKFAAEGWDLALCARNENDLLRLKSELRSPDIEILIQPCDMGKKEEVKLFADKILSQLGRVDVIVNNAGVSIPGQVINEAEGTLEKLIETNLYSAYHFSRTLLPPMIQCKSGHIFNMCSVASINAYPNGGSYSISKFGMLGLSKALREELKPHSIKVTSLLPGATLTDSWNGTDLPESRFMKAEDIAKAVWDIYHLSDSTVVEEIVLRPILGDL